MSVEKDDIIFTQYRTETCLKVAKAVLEGELAINWFPKKESEKTHVLGSFEELRRLSVEYLSGKYHGTPLAELEQKLFEKYSFMFSYTWIKFKEETSDKSSFEKRLDAINAAIDSENKILEYILKEIAEIRKQLDRAGL